MCVKRVSLSLVVVLLTVICGLAAQKSESSSGAAASGEMSFRYKFEGARFYLRSIEIDLGSNGTGILKFIRGESDEVLDSKIALMPATLSRIYQLFEQSAFLSSETAY